VLVDRLAAVEVSHRLLRTWRQHPKSAAIEADPAKTARASKTVSGGFPPTRVRIPPPPFCRRPRCVRARDDGGLQADRRLSAAYPAGNLPRRGDPTKGGYSPERRIPGAVTIRVSIACRSQGGLRHGSRASIVGRGELCVSRGRHCSKEAECGGDRCPPRDQLPRPLIPKRYWTPTPAPCNVAASNRLSAAVPNPFAQPSASTTPQRLTDRFVLASRTPPITENSRGVPLGTRGGSGRCAHAFCSIAGDPP
jgi:hypothetical protein